MEIIPGEVSVDQPPGRLASEHRLAAPLGGPVDVDVVGDSMSTPGRLVVSQPLGRLAPSIVQRHQIKIRIRITTKHFVFVMFPRILPLRTSETRDGPETLLQVDCNEVRYVSQSSD